MTIIWLALCNFDICFKMIGNLSQLDTSSVWSLGLKLGLSCLSLIARITDPNYLVDYTISYCFSHFLIFALMILHFLQRLVEGYLLRATQRSDIFAHILIWHLQVWKFYNFPQLDSMFFRWVCEEIYDYLHFPLRHFMIICKSWVLTLYWQGETCEPGKDASGKVCPSQRSLFKLVRTCLNDWKAIL